LREKINAPSIALFADLAGQSSRCIAARAAERIGTFELLVEQVALAKKRDVFAAVP